MESLRAPNRQDPAWVAKQQSKIDAALAAMAARLGDKAFCVDGRYSLADIALGCAIGYLDWRFPELGWKDEFPNLARHIKKLAARPSFAATVPPPA
jgi:glutathione S-transferase